MWTWNTILFEVFPYVALTLAIVGGVYRYMKDRYSYSSFSSQILEDRMLFWGSTLFHYAIIPILLAHLWQGLFPAWSLAVLGTPFTLFMAEMLGYILGYAAIIGLTILIFRRLYDPKARQVTTIFDWLMFAALAFQITTGVHIAHSYRWGTLWYAYTATQWFKSISYLDPNSVHIATLPWMVKAHAFNNYIIFLLFPFTRLVHIFAFPVTYIWRPFQVVMWNSWRSLRNAF